MVAQPAVPTRSGNAGEFSPDADGRIDVKQYYSAGKAYKNIEPVAQSGFRQMGGSLRKGRARRPLIGVTITSGTLAPGPHTGTQTIWTGTVADPVACVHVGGLEISSGSATWQVEIETAPGVWTVPGGHAFLASTTAGAVSRLAAFAPGGERAATGLRIRATFSGTSTVDIVTVQAFRESGAPLIPRHVGLMADNGTAYNGFVTAGIIDFFSAAGHVGAARLADVTGSMLPDLGFYAEGRTIGIFHPDLETIRLFQATDLTGHDWQVDAWPYDPPPSADLGGVYVKTNDVWDLTVRWTGITTLYLTITVDGESTPAVPLAIGGSPINTDVATGTDWSNFAAALEDALEALPSLGVGVTFASLGTGGTNSWLFKLTFGGALAGAEYQITTLVTNTTNVSALAYHTQVGATETEPVFSATQGWPGLCGLLQDRLAYARIRAVRGALALSRIAEYFDLNVAAPSDSGARLDRLRSQTSETIIGLKESTFPLVFTDLGAYFVSNRTIERNTPLNFVRASEIGAQPNCDAFDLEGTDYYVGIHPDGLSGRDGGGQQLLSLSYNDVALKYNANPVSLLASHLVGKVLRTARQKPATDQDAAKGWMMRADGRLVAAQMIVNQDIVGFCEWIAASGGLVREIGMDGLNRLWLAVERAGGITFEIYDTTVFLQDAITATPDLAGLVTGLPYEEGAALWAVASGFVLGPFTVSGGSIDLGGSHASALIGRWQAPRYETMAQVLVTGNDDVVLRPGRIHSVQANVIETTSIAIGANGLPAEDVPLLDALDPLDQPVPAKTRLIEVNGLPGMMTGTTMTVTQVRPGRLRVKDFALGVKL